MGNLPERINVELENIDEVLREMPPTSRFHGLSPLELAGVATLLHNFYNGVENILKQVFLSRGLPIPEGGSWHKDLLERAVDQRIMSGECRDRLVPYLAFRHFFSHAYALDLQADKMEPLAENLEPVFALFKKEMKLLR